MTLALIRFVNSLLDPLQRRDKNLPLSVLASTAGLPASFVEVRHWGTHESSLPGVQVLRDMGIRALEWLWHNYWNRRNEEVDFMQSWEEGGIEAGKVVASFQGNLDQSCERLVVQIGEDGEFDTEASKWDAFIARLSDDIPSFPPTFSEYLLQMLISVPSGKLFIFYPDADFSFARKLRTNCQVSFEHLINSLFCNGLSNGKEPSA